jgi:ubiquinone biosynthesis accessory factor UbiJ
MFAPVILSSLNHLLNQAEWARRRLLPHTGQLAELVLPAGTIRFRVDEHGFFTAAADGTPDLTLSAPAEATFAAFSGGEAAMKHVRIAGNAEFGESLGFVLRHLEWDAEADLARVVGGVAAPRLYRGLLDVLAWQRQALERLSANLRDYLVFEHPTLVAVTDLEDFTVELGRLRDDLARLEKRIARRETALAASSKP